MDLDANSVLVRIRSNSVHPDRFRVDSHFAWIVEREDCEPADQHRHKQVHHAAMEGGRLRVR